MDTQFDPLASIRDLLGDDPAPTTVVPATPEEVATFDDDAMVCTCNNVNAGEIRSLIRSGECSSLDDIQVRTRAGGGCGACIPFVAGIVNVELGCCGGK
ncbi:(2Fe-2S)-binding protein [Timonella senegalensis]|jgi:nitrite reductase (NADH) large subunit|uniref:(2Fe-2S)-binding protein n=1 Tax=Timonella senegalensis TaxID=1465825 RepID=UPI000302CBF7|nr:(2Fe-2S)-binding protein [Timonella senegalensis]